MSLQTECQNRIACLQQHLREQDLNGALYLYPIDIFYFCGTRQNAALWIPCEGDAVLFVRKSFQRAQQESFVADVRPFPRSKEWTDLLPQGRIGMPLDVVPAQLYLFYQKILAGREFVDISILNRSLRAVKSPWEIERMRYAGVQHARVFASMQDFVKPGMTELEVSAEFENRLRHCGAECHVRMRAYNQELHMGMAVVGESATVAGFFEGVVTGPGLSRAYNYGASHRVIEIDDPILIDYTAVFDGYIVDMTRTFVCGDLNPQLKAAFDTACDIQNWIASQLKPGAICSEIYDHAVAMAQEAGFADHFMGPPREQVRFVGHGVGLELDEFPILAAGFDQPLVAGHAIAVEPKFTFAGQGVVGIENTFIVGEEGGEKITVLDDDLIRISSSAE